MLAILPEQIWHKMKAHRLIYANISPCYLSSRFVAISQLLSCGEATNLLKKSVYGKAQEFEYWK
jgi:hypothetical protein